MMDTNEPTSNETTYEKLRIATAEAELIKARAEAAKASADAAAAQSRAEYEAEKTKRFSEESRRSPFWTRLHHGKINQELRPLMQH